MSYSNPKLKGDPTETAMYGKVLRKIYYHRLGTTQTEDFIVFEFDDPKYSMYDYEIYVLFEIYFEKMICFIFEPPIL